MNKQPMFVAIAGLAVVALLFVARYNGQAGADPITYSNYAYLPLVTKPEPTATPTATATFTATPTATASPTPTATPPSGLTRVIEPAEPWNPAQITIVPGAQFAVIKVRLLPPCENHNMGIGFVEVQDASGNPLNGVTVDFRNGPYQFSVVSGDKGPGKAEFVMLGQGNYSEWVASGTSDIASNMETYETAWNMPLSYRICTDTGSEGNAPKHLSYAVTFRRLQ